MTLNHNQLCDLFRLSPSQSLRNFGEDYFREMSGILCIDTVQNMDADQVKFILHSYAVKALFRCYFFAKSAKDIYYELCLTDEVYLVAQVLGYPQRKNRKEASEDIFHQVNIVKTGGTLTLVHSNCFEFYEKLDTHFYEKKISPEWCNPPHATGGEGVGKLH